MSEESVLEPSSVLSTKNKLFACSEFVMIPIEEGYLLDGGRQVERLTGQAALSALPLILPFIDGTRSIEEVAEALPGVSGSDIASLCQQLLHWGVFGQKADGYPEDQWSREIRNTCSFFRRGDGSTSLDITARTLAETHISIFSDEMAHGFAQGLLCALQQNGFTAAAICTELKSTADARAIVLSVVVRPSNPAQTEKHYAMLQACKTPWLHIILDLHAGLADVGPLFTADSKLCQACLRQTSTEVGRTGSSLGTTEAAALSALLATEITFLLLSPTQNSRAFRRYRTESFVSEVLTWPLACHCQDGQAGPAPSQRDLPQHYEDLITSRQEASDVGSSRPSSLQGSTKRLLSSDVVSLPRTSRDMPQPVLDLLLASHLPQPGSPKLEEIASLLALSVGIRSITDKGVQRWAPSGGNLGSPEAYLVVSEVEGLRRGVYCYRPEEHALRRLGKPGPERVEMAYAAVRSSAKLPALIVLVGAHSRIARKYGQFSYKLTHLDGGAASSQLLLVAAAMNIYVKPAPEWHVKDLAQALSLKLSEDVPLQVFTLGSPHSGLAPYSDTPVDAEDRNVEESLVSLQDEQPYQETIPVQLVSRTNLIRSRLPNPTAIKKPFSLRQFRDRLHGLTLGALALGGALNQRASMREFSAKAIPSKTVRALLHAALENTVLTDSGLSISVLVQRAESFPAGVYRLHPKNMALKSIRGAFQPGEVETLFLKNDYGSTPLIVWISGSAGEEYENQLVRAGVLGHRLWIAALAFGLGGTLVAGIRPNAASQQFSFLEEGEVGFLAFLCGYPASSLLEGR